MHGRIRVTQERKYKGMISLNHIYKIIWNKARACWQVVAETAKSSGKTKSSRRQNRRDNSLTLPALREYTKLAAALAVVLGCSLGGVVYAAEGETTRDGLLSYGAPSDAKSIFTTWQQGGYLQQGSSFNTITLSNAKLGFPYLKTGTTATINYGNISTASTLNTMITAYNAANSSANYSKIIAVVEYPDPNNSSATIKHEYTVFTSGATVVNKTYADIVAELNANYWSKADVAQKLADAQNITDAAARAAAVSAVLEAGLPKFYLVNSDGTVSTSLLPSSTPQYNGSNYSNWGFTFAGTIITTPGLPSDPEYSYTYDNPEVSAGSIWRPMDRVETQNGEVSGNYSIGRLWGYDSSGKLVAQTVNTTMLNVVNSDAIVTDPTAITVGNLTVGKGGTVDMSYINTTGSDPIVNHIYVNAKGDYSGTYPTGTYYPNGTIQYARSANRALLVENATLADGTVFRLGSYSILASSAANQTTKQSTLGNANDQVFITNASSGGGISKLYIQLGWVPGVGTASQGEAVWNGNKLDYPVLLGILNGAENFTVEGQKSLADGIFSQYEITPVIGQVDNYFNLSGTKVDGVPVGEQGTAWYLSSYSYLDLGTASESGRSAVDNVVATNNLWKSNYLNMFRRVGSLHRQGYIEQHIEETAGSVPGTLGIAEYPVEKPDQKENAWAEVWHGRYNSASGYGRQVSQSYNGMQAGYDKLLNHKIGSGKVYTGFYVSKVEGDSHTATGGGDQDSMGLGLYGAWVGDKGHYLDVAFLASRLSDNYHLTGNTGDGTTGRVTGDAATWAYGIGLQYGYQNALKNGWFWEPSAALYLGHTDETSYSLSNNLGIRQGGYDTVTGKVGVSVGKKLSGQGNVYAGVSAVHQFAGGSEINSFYGTQSMLLDTAAGKDTWWEFNLGGNMKISPAGTFNLDVSKTAGSSTGSDWRVNGGLNWTWGGFWEGSKAVTAEVDRSALPARTATTVIVGQAPEVHVKAEPQRAEQAVIAAVPAGQTDGIQGQGAMAADTAATAGAATQAPDNSNSVSVSTEPTALPQYANSGEFSFAPVTVEAARPNWEKELSPGQVSVIYPDKFEGEQKDLPDLLERVPGLFVQRVSGDGHYTVARVRGATGAQVAVYVDGVLMNLNGDAAVNLSTIPVDNVERIEVYRGYVPARFSGAPLGGVINIVTKKPKEVGGTITQGMKSYGGYNGTYQLTAPLGSGSIMATYQRDIWDGDIPFRMIVSDTDNGEYKRRSNGYQNSNGMVKWQDDNWMIKAAWKDLHEELPRSVSAMVMGEGVSWYQGYSDFYRKGYYDAEQDIKQKEFQLGRRDTVGNLDWGWRLHYLDSDKHYQHTGMIRGLAAGDLKPTYNPLPGTLWADYQSQKWGGNLNGSMKMGNSHLLEFNADISRETMDANGSDWDKVPAYYEKFGLNLLSKYEIKEYHLTLQDSITLNQAADFKLTPVLRADKVEMETLNDADHQWKYSGSAALQKQLNQHWSAKTSWGTYNRHPNFYEIFGDGAYITPNKGAGKFFDLSGQGTWESGTQFDFGLNWQGELMKADTDTVLTWFQRRSKNQFALWIPSVPNAPSTYFPMDEAKVHGIELTHAMKWNRLTLSLAGTWQQSEYTDSKMSSGRKSTISYTPEWVWNARLDYRFDDRLSAYAGYNYTSKQYLGANDSREVDNYLRPLTTVDLGVKYAFAKGWKLSAGVNDIFNKGYEQRQYQLNGIAGTNGQGYYWSSLTPTYPIAGRTYYATMEYKF